MELPFKKEISPFFLVENYHNTRDKGHNKKEW